MRAIAVLLLATCLAGSAFAQFTSPDSPTSLGSPATAASTAHPAAAAAPAPTMINGKYVVGYEGRGDYVKNAQLEKGIVPTQAATGAARSLSDSKGGNAANAPVAATEAPPAPVAQSMRSDSALGGDAARPKAAAPAVSTASQPVSSTQNNTQNNSQSNTANNPMVLVGGQMQRRD